MGVDVARREALGVHTAPDDHSSAQMLVAANPAAKLADVQVGVEEMLGGDARCPPTPGATTVIGHHHPLAEGATGERNEL